MKEKNLLNLFLTFLKIGALTFGGGYAMMPVMRKEVVEKHGWVDDDDILKILVISESTPGVLAINSATFIGYKIGGFKGSLLATLGVIVPSFIIISLISIFFFQFRSNPWVASAFLGIKVGVAILIFQAGLKLYRKIKKTAFTYIMFVSAFLLALFTPISAIYFVLAGAVLGVIFGYITSLKGVSKND